MFGQQLGEDCGRFGLTLDGSWGEPRQARRWWEGRWALWSRRRAVSQQLEIAGKRSLTDSRTTVQSTIECWSNRQDQKPTWQMTQQRMVLTAYRILAIHAISMRLWIASSRSSLYATTSRTACTCSRRTNRIVWVQAAVLSRPLAISWSRIAITDRMMVENNNCVLEPEGFLEVIYSLTDRFE